MGFAPSGEHDEVTMPIDAASMDALLAKMNAMREVIPRAGVAGAARADGQPDFAAALKASIESVDATQKASAELSQRFQLGDAKVTLEETMVAMAKANVSFQQMVQVRNRVIAAYHDIMNMQV
jgi:flagellar hook-basal body complex protein FliE